MSFQAEQTIHHGSGSGSYNGGAYNGGSYNGSSYNGSSYSGGYAALSLTRLQAYERGGTKGSYAKFEIILFALIMGLLLFTLGMGVNVYRNISIQRWADEQNRTGLTLIANSIRITDTTDAVGVGAGPEGQALVLTERFDDGTYETRIYLHEGFIVEEYSLAGAPYAPQRATQLVESSTFSFAYSGGLLTVHTDQGTQEVMLHSVRRSAEGGSATAGNAATSNATAGNATAGNAANTDATVESGAAGSSATDNAEAEGGAADES